MNVHYVVGNHDLAGLIPTVKAYVEALPADSVVTVQYIECTAELRWYCAITHKE